MARTLRWTQVSQLKKSKSKYAFPKYDLLFSETLAKGYGPIVYSHECLSGPPEAVYHRILAKEANSPISVKELADKTGTVERLVSEWLANQVASGYIEYDPSSRKYRLPPEHALALADENSPVYLQGIFKAIKSYFKDEEEFLKMFRGERTLSWMDHNPFMAEGFAEFFKSGYIGNLINSWIPAVDNGNILDLNIWDFVSQVFFLHYD